MMKTYIIQIRDEGTPPDLRPRKRSEAIRLAKERFNTRMKGVWERLAKVGVTVRPSTENDRSFLADDGIRFTCLSTIGTVIALIPDTLVEHFRNDPAVSMVTADRKLTLQPC